MLQGLLDKVSAGGPPLQVLAAATVLAALVSLILLISLVASGGSGLLRTLSVVCLLSGVAIAGSGAWGAFKGRQTVDASVASLRPGKAERARLEGYREKSTEAGLPLALAAAPLILGLVGLRTSARRRWTEEHETPPPGVGIPILFFLAALVGLGVDAYFWKVPVTGRELDETGWRVLDLRDSLDANEFDACLTTDLEMDWRSPTKEMGELKDSQRRCAKHYLDDPAAKADDVDKLLAAKWLTDPALRRALQDKLEELKGHAAGAGPVPAAAGAPRPTPAPRPSTPDPAVEKAQASVQKCLKKAGKKEPKLPPHASVELSIASDGKVATVKEDGASHLPHATQKCIAAALKKVAFRAGEARSVELALEPAPR